MAKHILIVDDSKDARDSKKAIIEGLGDGQFTCETAEDGRKCLDRLEIKPSVDLIVLDLEMPEVNGVDVMRTILKKDPVPKLKILICSARADGWMSDWNAMDLQGYSAFAEIVLKESYGKAAGAQAFMSMVREAFEEGKHGI